MKKKHYQQPTTAVVGLHQQKVLMASGDGKGIQATRQTYEKQSEQSWE